MSDGSGQTAWSYDAVGNILTERKAIQTATNAISYAYNLDRSIKSIIYPSKYIVSYIYSNAQRALSAIDSGSGINYVTGTCGPNSNGVCYSPPGSITSAIHGQTTGFGGVIESYAYNNRLEPTSIKAATATSVIMSLVPGFALPNGNNGTVSSVGNADGRDAGRNQSFTYDPLNRLLTAQSQATSGPDCWGDGYSYDRWGNLLAATPTQCSSYPLSLGVDLHNHIIANGFGYDLAGNMTSDGQFSYSWNAENQLTSAAGVNYQYDGNSFRMSKSSGTLYWRSVVGQTLAESDSTGSTSNGNYYEYVFFAGRRIARRDSSGTVLYYFADQVGSARVIFRSDNRTVCFDSDYTPFGTELPANGVTVTCPQNYKFDGYERDPETGLDYSIFRHYNSHIARFMSTDPVAGSLDDPQSMNGYSFGLNDPCSLTDPLGLTTQCTLVVNIKNNLLTSPDQQQTIKQQVIDILGQADIGVQFNAVTDKNPGDPSADVNLTIGKVTDDTSLDTPEKLNYADVNINHGHTPPGSSNSYVYADHITQAANTYEALQANAPDIFRREFDPAVAAGNTAAHELVHALTGPGHYEGKEPNLMAKNGSLGYSEFDKKTDWNNLTKKQRDDLLTACKNRKRSGGGNDEGGDPFWYAIVDCYYNEERGWSCRVVPVGIK